MSQYPQAQNPLVLRFHRLLEAFAKSDDERDFYLDTIEGFILFVDCDKPSEDLKCIEEELAIHAKRYLMIPKMTYYETKKFMESFVNEKVYDIDTKEKLLDVIQSKEARENFLEFIYDHLPELEKWQQYYHERSRIRIIEWLRDHDVKFVFEEDLDIVRPVMEKLKQHLFDEKVSKDVQQARQAIVAKSKTYYSSEALNPRPKRGRPPKQAAKVEVEPTLTPDLYTTVTPAARHFLFMPEYSPSAVLFSSKFDNEEQLRASLKGASRAKVDTKLEALSQRLESLRHLSDRLRSADGLLSKGEQRLVEAVAEVPSARSIKTAEQPTKIKDIAHGFLPKKRTDATVDSNQVQDMMEKKKKAGIKQVSVIQKKPQK